MCLKIKLLPFQGVDGFADDTQGAASLALGYARLWAFSPPSLNPGSARFYEYAFKD